MNMKKPSVSFANPQSQELFLLKEHALISISPFNSYYSQENLNKLFSWGLSSFKKINIFIPDMISVYTLQAIGYSEMKAKRKTRLHDNSLKNKALRALLANNLSEDIANDMMIFCNDLMHHNEKYLKFHKIYKKLYEDDENFRDGCLATSKRVLASKDILGVNNDEAADIAAKYFLAELPLQLNASEILDVPSSLYVYKNPPSDFLTNVYSKNSPFYLHVSPRHGYMTVNFTE
jgi:cyclo(L-tyrosyl-L-tyrosyl) synthase